MLRNWLASIFVLLFALAFGVGLTVRDLLLRRRLRYVLRSRGTCPACPADLVCTVPADCQSGGCDVGKCRAPTCTDGFRDGLESDVDCGAACRDCDTGKHCANGDDCASANCVAGTCGS